MASRTARARADALPERCRQMKELGEIVETGPDPAVDGVVRWRRIDLKRVIEERFGVIYSERGYPDCLANWASPISARPQHPKTDKRIIEAFKKTSRHAPAELPRTPGEACPERRRDRAVVAMKPASALNKPKMGQTGLTCLSHGMRARARDQRSAIATPISSARSVRERKGAGLMHALVRHATPWRRTSSRSVPPSPGPMRLC